MLNKIQLYLKNFDWILFLSVLLLACLGLAEIYSVALGQETVSLLNFKKQIFFIGAGIFLLFLFSFLDYHFLRNSSNYLYLLGIVTLIALLIFGRTVRGTRGWFFLGAWSFQPVEFIKIILIIFLARFFSILSTQLRPWKHLILSGLGGLLFIILILLQPDFGSALILLLIWLVMVIMAGFSKKHLMAVILILLVVFSGLWTFSFKDYQKERVATFLNPSFEPLKQGYNVAQAIIAVGAGGLFGRGLGFGSQSQLKFLPESQNDFIFAVISEELGFLGVSLVIFLFAIFFYRCLAALEKINNDFGIFFILGVVGLIFIEMFINIGMNIGILPVVGIPLPFVSYGGSAILSIFILVGIIESIIIRSKINY
ncbi:MAG: rod shape-determining protein RodA [Patescibacteria group bacterium]|nr:rod shape-determining protein RodA [Patescibacteria group bacterium]